MFAWPRKKYETLNTIYIYKDRLLHNFKKIQEWAGNKKIGIVVKSNGYGHGIIEIAKIVDNQNIEFIFADSTYEALRLKDAGIKTPILILGFTRPENLQKKKYPFAFMAHSKESLETIHKTQPQSPIHLFFNTGMNREGFDIDELNWITKFITEKNANIEGIASHFAEADYMMPTQLTHSQVDTFQKIINHFENKKIPLKYTYMDASNSIVFGLENPGNLIRAGRVLYGTGKDHPKYEELKPALELVSRIVQIRTIRAGETVGYASNFRAPTDMKIALIPIGYQEGLERRLSNKGFMIVDGTICNIVGNISMNYSTINISHVEAKVGDEVIVYSKEKSDPNSLAQTAKLCNTIEHEILTRLNHTVRRIVK